jgi:hypothetical protein
MRPKTSTIVLAIVGSGTILAGFIIGAQDVGSCPFDQPSCFHTFPGTSIRIVDVFIILELVGLVLLVAALPVAMYMGRAQTNSKPE